MEREKAVVYTRVASAKGARMAHESQRQVCLLYAQMNGYKVIGKYKDTGKSGGKSFQKLLDDARNGKFKFLIVSRVDRLTRNIPEYLEYAREFRRHGISVLCAMGENEKNIYDLLNDFAKGEK